MMSGNVFFEMPQFPDIFGNGVLLHVVGCCPQMDSRENVLGILFDFSDNNLTLCDMCVFVALNMV